MAFVRTVLIILALLLGWTALRHQGLANNEASAPTASVPAASVPAASAPTASVSAG